MTGRCLLVWSMAVWAVVAGRVQAQPAGPPKVDPAGKILLAAKAHYDAGRHEMAADAYQDFLKTFATDPRATGARYGLGGCWYHLRQYKQAAAEMALVAGVKDFAQHNDALLVTGYCHLVLKDYAKTVTVCQRLMTEAPGSTQALSAAMYRIQALFFGGKTAECAEACQAYVKAHPTAASRFVARYFQGQSLRKLGKNAEAVAALAELVSRPNDPQRLDAMVLSAQCLRDLQKYPQAEALYRQVLKSAPPARLPAAHYGLAVVLYDAGNYAQAVVECKAVLAYDNCPYAPAARYRLGLAQWAAGKTADARTTLKVVAKTDTARLAKARYWLVRCDMADGKYAEARKALLVLARGKVDNPEQIAFDLAMCSLSGEDFSRGASEFAACRKAYPKGDHAVETLYRQAFCLHQLKQYPESQTLCEKVARAPACSITAAAAELSAENLLLAGTYDAAGKAFAALADTAIKAKDAAAAIRFAVRRGQCAHLAGHHDQAVKILAPLAAGRKLAADAVLGEAVLQLGESQMALKQYDAAVATLRGYLAAAKRHLDQARCELGLAYLRDGKTAQAARAFADGMKGDAASPWVVRSAFEYGDLAYRQGRGSEAAAALTKVLAGKGATPELAGGAAYLLAWIDYNAKRYPQAAARFGAMAKDHPKHANAADAVFQQACCTLLADDRKGALALFNSYIAAHPAGAKVARARHMAARCLAELDRHAEAKAAYAALCADRKTVSDEALYGLAWAQRETNEPDRAAATYRRLIKEYPKSPTLPAARTELGGMLYLQKEYKAAAELLEAVLADESAEDRLLQAAGYQAACCYEKMGDEVKTAAAMAAFAAEYPRHAHAPSALYQAGVAQAALKKYDESIKHFSLLVRTFSAHDLLPNAYIKLGQVQNNSGRFTEAASTFEAYLAKFPKGQWAYLARFGMGWAFEGRKKYPEARTWYALVEKTHDGPTAARAKYQIGQTYFAERNYTRAAAELISVDSVYAYPEWSAKALLEAGNVFLAARDVDSAKAQYALCIKKYPKSKESLLAAAELKRLGG